MMTVIREEFAEWTVLVAAHRLETTRGFDRAVVMDRGSVVGVAVMRVVGNGEGGVVWEVIGGLALIRSLNP
jgi:ABC-type transport system involved in cytochrome bd biosynthesis fused ATPase/permease subunit